MTANGYALCIGLNSVDPEHYAGWSGQLNACEADAKSMHALLSKRGFTSIVCLRTRDATRKNVLDHILALANMAQPGDLFVLTNSSHGGQLPDTNGDESDGMDETICLYDGELIDDELYHALGAFKAGVRVLVLSDSCHSGTVTRMYEPSLSPYPRALHEPATRLLPPDVALATYHAHQDFYDLLQTKPGLKDAKEQLKASVMLISGCMDNQTSLDGLYNGLFTGTLLRVWNGGAFKGSYKQLRSQIVRRMPSDQTPNLYWASARDAHFEAQQPFTI